MEGVDAGLNARIDRLYDNVTGLREDVGALKGRVDELSGFVRALLPPRVA
mgnify:CR=1 FL=1